MTLDDHLRAVVSVRRWAKQGDYQQRTGASVRHLLLWWMGFRLSVATGTGFIILPSPTGVVMRCIYVTP